MTSPSGTIPQLKDQEWQGGQDRALLYLRMLGVPGIEALEIALEAMRRARARAEQHPGAVPVYEVMQTLRRVLEERTNSPASDPKSCIVPFCEWPTVPEQLGIPEETRSMPPINRGTMPPQSR